MTVTNEYMYPTKEEVYDHGGVILRYNPEEDQHVLSIIYDDEVMTCDFTFYNLDTKLYVDKFISICGMIKKIITERELMEIPPNLTCLQCGSDYCACGYYFKVAEDCKNLGEIIQNDLIKVFNIKEGENNEKHNEER